MTTSVTRPCFTTQHHTRKTKTKIKTDFFWSETADVADNGRSLVCNAQKYPNSEGNVCTRHEPDDFSVSQQTSASDGSG